MIQPTAIVLILSGSGGFGGNSRCMRLLHLSIVFKYVHKSSHMYRHQDELWDAWEQETIQYSCWRYGLKKELMFMCLISWVLWLNSPKLFIFMALDVSTRAIRIIVS